MKPETQAHTILRDLSSGYSVSTHRCQLDNAGGILGTLKEKSGDAGTIPVTGLEEIKYRGNQSSSESTLL